VANPEYLGKKSLCGTNSATEFGLKTIKFVQRCQAAGNYFLWLWNDWPFCSSYRCCL